MQPSRQIALRPKEAKLLYARTCGLYERSPSSPGGFTGPPLIVLRAGARDGGQEPRHDSLTRRLSALATSVEISYSKVMENNQRKQLSDYAKDVLNQVRMVGIVRDELVSEHVRRTKDLRFLCLRAIQAGAPESRVREEAGVALTTLRRWQGKDGQPGTLFEDGEPREDDQG